ncbi:glycosyl hydrolase [Clostridia bacterium]|nr:glycosyl hydrolase [Clostridia bacterium]
MDTSPFVVENGSLIRRFDSETLILTPWGTDGIRIRAYRFAQKREEDWALINHPESSPDFSIDDNGASVRNGKLTAKVTRAGKLTFYNQNGVKLLEEYVRNRVDVRGDCSALDIDAREFKPRTGGDYELSMRFESDPNERLFGMGQYQQPYLNLKGCQLELAQRNSQASVPFMVSSLGYGFLWNNPAVGEVTFGRNLTRWFAHSAVQLDYWITAGDSPSEIEEAYAQVSGTVPMMPEYGLGFWQCKLRYTTQDELLAVAREYKKRGLPINLIVIDFFHWPTQGDWRFDELYWPDPQAMVDELKELGIELMVSIWPTVDRNSENYAEMRDKGYLIKAERGVQISMEFMGNTVHYDATNPDARAYVWNKAKKNYYDLGIRVFWLDEAEPEYKVYHFDNYRYHTGTDLQIGNSYPLEYARTFYEGMTSEGQTNIVNLLRCAWAGSQRYGALVWSGDIASTFASLRNQLAAGLNMGIAGIPWWTTDIGGFHGGQVNDPEFRELLIRWFQWGAFCPVFRLHGDREPHYPPMATTGSGSLASGADNEVWSYGEEAYDIFTKYMTIRERLRPYIRERMKEAHEKGTPVIRPLFYDFPNDPAAWDVSDEYMFGPDYLVAPILYANVREREVVFPSGVNWRSFDNEAVYAGGSKAKVAAPLDTIPVFRKV